MGFLLGFGVGGIQLLLRLTWADYYGRMHLGSIRGLTLPAQIGGQAMGPIIAGFMFDSTGSYETPFTVFGIIVALAAVMVFAATPPGPLLHEQSQIRGEYRCEYFFRLFLVYTASEFVSMLSLAFRQIPILECHPPSCRRVD